jgi:tetratricopeptide (TPR) repeat protein
MGEHKGNTLSLEKVYCSVREIIQEAGNEKTVDPEKTIIYAKTALNTAQQNRMPEEEFDCHLLLVDGFFRLKNYRQAMECVEEALSLAGNLHPLRRTDALIRCGDILQAENNDNKALHSYQEALRIVEDSAPDNRIYGSIIQKIAALYTKQSKFTLAQDYYQELLEWSEKQTDQEIAATALIRLGILHNSSFSYSKALECFLRSLAIFRRLNHIDGILLNRINLGLLYWRRYQYNKALEHMQEAYRLRDETTDKYLPYEISSILSIIYQSLDQKDDYQKHQTEAIRLKFDVHQTPELIATDNRMNTTLGYRLNSLLNVIRRFIESGAGDSIREGVNEVLSLIEKVDNKDLVQKACKVISEYYHHLNEYEQSGIFYMRHIKLNEEILNEREIVHFSEVENSHSLTESEQKAEESINNAKTSAALAVAATASHEVNQPLMIIVGNLELLQKSLRELELSEKQEKYIKNIKTGVDRITDILNKFQNEKDIQFQEYIKSNEMVVFNDPKEPEEEKA